MGRPLPNLGAAPAQGTTPAPLGGMGPVSIGGIEVTQTVQALDNSVVLIANKPTMVRVYVDQQAFPAAGTITGEITWRRTGGSGATFHPAMNSVLIDPTKRKKLSAQRYDLNESLNFLLPSEAIAAGQVEIAVNRIMMAGGDLSVQPNPPINVTFTASPPLRVRAIGLRYRNGGAPGRLTPAAIHFAYLRSFLTRAYPVSSLEWSQIVIDADFGPPFDEQTALLANAQIAALRSREISSGIDPRTHYYGLVDDNNGTETCFMRGAAFDIPAAPQPDIVASGPCGSPAVFFPWDRGVSYAGWYGAHELGHTFGRSHPGFPSGGQTADDAHYPYPEGLLTEHEQHVGFDVGDIGLNIPIAVLPGHLHHDVMTYADNQWICSYTYQAIFERLVTEDRQFA